MRGRWTVRVGLFLAAIALGLGSTGCFPAGPPAAPASLSVRPSPATFPSTPPPYSPMPIVQVTVTNTGGRAARSLAVNGVGVYSVPSNACATVGALSPGQSCVADVQFCPTSPGHYLNTLVVTGQDAVSGSPLQTATTLDGTAT